MNPKASYAEKLKRYRKDKAEDYAQTILATPQKKPLYPALRFPGVIIIMGDIRSGKTALAHEIAHEFHKRRNLPAVMHIPKLTDKDRKRMQKLLPSWMKIVSQRSQWPERAVVIYDEAAQSAHARRSQSGDAVELDELLAISGQREQLILFISHYSRKLDLNICTSVHRIIWKRPTYAHQIWERDEMADFTMRAYDFFQGIKGNTAKQKASLILNMEDFGFYQSKNKLPPWWSDGLSRIFKDIQTTRNGTGVYE